MRTESFVFVCGEIDRDCDWTVAAYVGLSPGTDAAIWQVDNQFAVLEILQRQFQCEGFVIDEFFPEGSVLKYIVIEPSTSLCPTDGSWDVSQPTANFAVWLLLIVML